jgi:inorganic pyrophosphatase
MLTPSIRTHRSRVVASLVLTAALVLGVGTAGAARAETDDLFDKDLKKVDDYTYKSPKRNLLTNRKARNEDGSINVVIEIPAGTNQKWEVSPDGKELVWEFTGDKPRIVDYLVYPGNYGMVQRTLLDLDTGGDGQPLDVMVLGTTLPRGTEIRAIPIGVIRVIDRFEQDDKIVAVQENAFFNEVVSIESLNDRYPGVSEILRIWFSNVHGTSDVQFMGTGSRGQANAVIDFAADAYIKKSVASSVTDAQEKAAEKEAKKERNEKRPGMKN